MRCACQKASHAMMPMAHAAATPMPIPISQVFLLTPLRWGVVGPGCAARGVRGSATVVGGISG